MRQNEKAVEVRELVRARVRRLRAERGLSARQLCLAMARHGVTMGRTTLANYENGRRDDLTVSEAVAMALAFDVRLADLVADRLDTATTVALGEEAVVAAELSERLRLPYRMSANELRDLRARVLDPIDDMRDALRETVAELVREELDQQHEQENE